MTARQLNKHVFVVGRQNFETNELLYTKINEHYHAATRDGSEELHTIAHLAMRPSEIIARRIRAILIAPLLIDFIDNALLEDQQWANITISRLTAVMGENSPTIWTVRINKEDAPAVAQALGFGRSIQLRHITRDQKCLSKTLAGMTLLLKRGEKIQLLPDDNTELKALDELLFCGLRNVKDCMSSTLTDISLLNYVMTSKNEPQSFIWRKISRLSQKTERRLSKR
jgi:hypothetical protein